MNTRALAIAAMTRSLQSGAESRLRPVTNLAVSRDGRVRSWRASEHHLGLEVSAWGRRGAGVAFNIEGGRPGRAERTKSDEITYMPKADRRASAFPSRMLRVCAAAQRPLIRWARPRARWRASRRASDSRDNSIGRARRGPIRAAATCQVSASGCARRPDWRRRRVERIPARRPSLFRCCCCCCCCCCCFKGGARRGPPIQPAKCQCRFRHLLRAAAE